METSTRLRRANHRRVEDGIDLQIACRRHQRGIQACVLMARQGSLRIRHLEELEAQAGHLASYARTLTGIYDRYFDEGLLSLLEEVAA